MMRVLAGVEIGHLESVEPPSAVAPTLSQYLSVFDVVPVLGHHRGYRRGKLQRGFR
jgi:hypothetical protein